MLTFLFNGISSETFGILVEESNIYTKAKKRIETIQVPGRTGDLLVYDGLENGARENITLTLNCHIEIETSNKPELLEQMDTWLNGHRGYKELVFSNGIAYNAVFIGELSLPTTDFFYTDFELTFSAYPI